MTALALVLDKKRRVLERLLSTGVSPMELMLGNFMAQLGVLAVQVGAAWSVGLIAFDLV